MPSASSIQPDLPVHQVPKTVDFFPEGPDGVVWTVKCWPELRELFQIESRELEEWHVSLANKESRPWNVVRRLFGVVPMFGEACEDDDDEEWDQKSLAKHWGLPEKVLQDDLKAIVEFWTKLRVSKSIQQSAVNPVDRQQSKNPAAAMADQEIDHLLEEYRFDHLKGKDRVFVARRIIELRNLFEDKNRREPARQLVHMELNLQDNERSRTLMKSRLDVLSKKADRDGLVDKDASEVIKLNESLENNEKSHSRLFSSYISALDDLGSEEIEQVELRKAALGTASYFVESVRQYYLSGDRSLIDGVFPADELLWLTTPVSLRPAQYRPDFVVAVNDAMKPFNLFDPDYKPLRIPREAARRMIKIARSLVDEEEALHIPEIDSVSTGDDEDADSVSALDLESSGVAPEHSPTAGPPPDPSVVAPSHAQALDDFMAI